MLDEHGLSAEIIDIDVVSDLGRYDAVVLGSAVYMGQWLKQDLRVFPVERLRHE